MVKLQEYGITGRVLDLIRQMHTDTRNSIRLNGHLTPSFMSEQGVKQGYNMAPTCFCAFIDGLLRSLSSLGIGVNIDDAGIVCSLAYADDIVLLAENEDSLQQLLDEVDRWCKNWRVSVNTGKTKVMHFRPKQKPKCTNVFSIGANNLETVESYCYLGVVLDELASEYGIVDELSKAGSSALSNMIGKTRDNYDLGYSSFTKLYHMTVVSILEYAVGAWGIGLMNCRKLDQIQECAICFYAGLPKSAPLLALTGDSGWVPGLVRRDVETLRFYNQLMRMDRT